MELVSDDAKAFPCRMCTHRNSFCTLEVTSFNSFQCGLRHYLHALFFSLKALFFSSTRVHVNVSTKSVLNIVMVYGKEMAKYCLRFTYLYTDLRGSFIKIRITAAPPSPSTTNTRKFRQNDMRKTAKTFPMNKDEAEPTNGQEPQPRHPCLCKYAYTMHTTVTSENTHKMRIHYVNTGRSKKNIEGSEGRRPRRGTVQHAIDLLLKTSCRSSATLAPGTGVHVT